MIKGFRDFQHVTVTVSDIGRALAFYRDLLGLAYMGRLTYREKGLVIDFLDLGDGYILELFSSTGAWKASHALPDDRQRGLRHIGLKVRDVDATTARLKAAGTKFIVEPRFGAGGARLAFFEDPDGTWLEIIGGPITYHRRFGERSRPWVAPLGDSVGLDHVTTTVSSLDAALAHYRDILGFPLLGQLDKEGGLTISYLEAGGVSLEIFSYPSATIANPWDPDESVLGLKHLGFLVDDVDEAAAGLREAGIRFIYEPADALGEVKTSFFADQDGNALELIDGTPRYDE